MNDRTRSEGLISPLLIRVGSGADDSLTGGGAADQFYGYAGNDTLRGLGGNDWFEPGSDNDLVDGGAGAHDLVNYGDTTEDIPVVRGIDLDLAAGTAQDGWNGTDTLLGIEDVLGSSHGDRIAGNGVANAFSGRGGDDTLLGGGGNDWLRAGAGNDSVDGGAGYDTVSYEDDSTEPGATQGVRVDLGKGTATDGWNDDDTLTGIEAVTGSSRADRITGNGAGNVLQGMAGADTLNGAAGDDWLEPERGDDSVDGGTGVDTLSYANGPTPLHGATVDLDAGSALDPWNGSDNLSRIEIVLGSALGDELRASNAGGSDLEGRAGNDTLLGGTADDWLQPGRGADSVDGGAGLDWLSYVEDDGVLATHGVVVDLPKGSATDGWDAQDVLLALENVAGSLQADSITGLGHHSRLEGRGGNDTLAGGDISYEPDPAGVFVNLTDAAVTHNQLTAAARSALDGYGGVDSLGAGVVSGFGSPFDDTWFTSHADSFVIARGGDDFIVAGEGSDWLQPGSGNDTVNGGANADGVSYQDDGYDDAGPATSGVVVNLTTGTATDGWGGSDVLIGIEDVYGSKLADRLTGSAVSNYLEGGEGNDTLRGQDGDDFIVGGEGNDLVYGNAGADFYGLSGASLTDYSIVQNPDGSRTVTDLNTADGNDGTDTLFGVETLGLARIGTDDSDQIVSNSASAILAIGGDGDDVYILSHPDDRVLEHAGDGTDTVETDYSHELEPNVENLVLTGAGDLVGTGNEADNALTGNTGNNTLDGAAGADTLQAGDGNDTYYVDDVNDLVIESASLALARPGEPSVGGTNTDTVISIVTFTLRANLENLTLSGGSAIGGTGNALNNIIGGNGSANLLRGQDGNDTLGGGGGRDTLDGGAGSDSLSGGAGGDAFLFRVAPTATGNRDTVADFLSGTDQLRLDDDAFTVFSSAQSTALDPDAFWSSGTSLAHDASDRILYNTSTGALLYDPDGNGDSPALRFATLTGAPTLAASDFLVTG